MNINLNRVEINKFPDGMVQTLLPEGIEYDKSCDLYGSIRSHDELMTLVQVVQILRTNKVKEIRLTIHYLIGSRMDRANTPRGANILRTVCDVINSLNLDEVSVIWPHSSTTLDLLNAKHNVNSERNFLLRAMKQLREQDVILDGFDIVLPDAGAGKRFWNDHSEAIAGSWSPNYRVVECGKHRDVLTGEITSSTVPYGVSDTCVIIDDLLDGGKTFLELAKELRKKGAETVALVVYHGIMSKGLPIDGIDYVVTSNSFREFGVENNLHVRKVI